MLFLGWAKAETEAERPLLQTLLESALGPEHIRGNLPQRHAAHLCCRPPSPHRQKHIDLRFVGPGVTSPESLLRGRGIVRACREVKDKKWRRSASQLLP